MIKCRLTYVNDEDGIRERDFIIENIKNNCRILSMSREYEGRGNSNYNNIYLDIEKL